MGAPERAAHDSPTVIKVPERQLGGSWASGMWLSSGFFSVLDFALLREDRGVAHGAWAFGIGVRRGRESSEEDRVSCGR